MQKITNLFLMALLLLTFAPLQKVNAGGGGGSNITVSVNKTSATADGADTITITVKSWLYKCTGTKPEGSMISDLTTIADGCAPFSPPTYTPVGLPFDYTGYYLNISGEGNNQPSKQVLTTNASGLASFSLKSSVAGTKNIQVSFEGPVVGINSAESVTTKTVTFNAPAATATAKKTTPTTATTPAPTTTQLAKPAVPSVVDATIGAQKTEIKTGEIPQFTFKQEDGVTFSGKTVPNGKVTLYFQSEPFSDTTTADANGVWTYVLKKDLGEGEHSLETTVTDPTNNLTSDKSSAVKFALNYEKKADEPTNSVVISPEKLNNSLWYYVGGALALLVIAGAGTLVYLKRRKAKTVIASDKK